MLTPRIPMSISGSAAGPVWTDLLPAAPERPQWPRFPQRRRRTGDWPRRPMQQSTIRRAKAQVRAMEEHDASTAGGTRPFLRPATSAGYRSHRRRRQAPIVGIGSEPTRRPHAPRNGPGAPRRYATRATAPSSPHPPAACRQDRPRMQRLPTTAPSIRPIRTQSTPSDTFLVNLPSTARFADLRQNDRQRRSHQALTAGAEREDAPSRTAHLTHRAVPAPSRTCSPHAPAADGHLRTGAEWRAANLPVPAECNGSGNLPGTHRVKAVSKTRRHAASDGRPGNGRRHAT